MTCTCVSFMKGEIMRIVPIGCVMEGTVLAKDIMNSQGTILLKKGVVLNESLLKRIEDNNVLSLYIDDGYSDQEINDVIRPEVRQKTVLAIKETFENIERFNIIEQNGVGQGTTG